MWDCATLSEMEPGAGPNWALSAEGIYFVKFGKCPRAGLAFFDFARGKTHVLWPLEKGAGWGLSLSANGKSLVYIQHQFAQSNLMMVRNFR